MEDADREGAQQLVSFLEDHPGMPYCFKCLTTSVGAISEARLRLLLADRKLWTEHTAFHRYQGRCARCRGYGMVSLNVNTEPTPITNEPVEFEHLPTFAAFVNHVDLKAHQHGVVYRGHRDAGWALESSMVRLVRDNLEQGLRESAPVLSHNVVSGGCRARSSFTDRLVPFMQRGDQLPDEELWAQMQHHAGFSPLLDWTRSPYVAAFFAYADIVRTTKEGDRAGKNVAIWALSVAACRELCKDHGIPFRIIRGIHHGNQRLLAQQGCFTYCDSHLPIEELPFKIGSWRFPYLRKLTLPWDEMEMALTHLNRMNINFTTLFPDPQGAALHAAMNCVMPGYEGLNPPFEQLIRENDSLQ